MPSSVTARVLPLVALLALAACSATPATPADASAPAPVDAPARCRADASLAPPDDAPAVCDRCALADLRFARDDGAPVALHTWLAPCATPPRLLLIRTLAAWSGRALHAAAHTRRLLAHPQRDRVALLDLLALGPDNTPATPDDLAAWRGRYDALPDALAVDPAYQFKPLYADAGQLPLYAFVDTRTMRVVATLEAPSSAVVASVITTTLAAFDHRPQRPITTEPLVDGRFTQDDWEILQAMSPPGAPPRDPTNRVADDPRAASLGDALFHDPGLSSNGTVSCATCHAAERLFTDGRAQALGVTRGDRNTPTVLLAPYARWTFLDGRADTLWAQALGPIENPLEMGATRLATAHRTASRHATPTTTPRCSARCRRSPTRRVFPRRECPVSRRGTPCRPPTATPSRGCS